MAKPASRQPRRKGAAPAAGPRRASVAPLLLSIAVGLMVVFSFATVLLLIFGMLPTIVAFIIDRTPSKYSAYCVGGMNVSGVFPYVLELWNTGNNFAVAKHILTDVFALAVMYGASGFGWMVYLAVPPVVGAFLTVMAQRRVALLRTTQRNLIEEWGEDVANPMSELRRK